MPQVKLGPETLEEKHLGILVALPQHKVAQSLHPTSPHKDVERWAVGRVQVLVNRLGRDVLDVGVYGNVAGAVLGSTARGIGV